MDIDIAIIGSPFICVYLWFRTIFLAPKQLFDQILGQHIKPLFFFVIFRELPCQSYSVFATCYLSQLQAPQPTSAQATTRHSASSPASYRSLPTHPTEGKMLLVALSLDI